MGKTFQGTTKQADGVPILGADFFNKNGVSISGTVTRAFSTANGVCYEIALSKPVKVKVDGELKEVSRAAVGALKGFEMAMGVAMGNETLLSGDKIDLTRTGSTESGKGSPRIDFDLKVERP